MPASSPARSDDFLNVRVAGPEGSKRLDEARA